MSARRLRIAAVAIAALYVATRLLLLARFPYFIDEGEHAQFTLEASQRTSALFGSLTIAKEPMSIWLGILPVKLGVSPLIATRLVSFGAGAVTMIMCGLLARHLSGDAAGLAAAALYALLPLFLVHDVIGIMDPLLTAILAGALYLQLRLAERPSWKLGLALGLVLGAGILTKESAKLGLALLPLSLLAFDWRAQGRRATLTRWLACVALALVLTAMAYLILRSSSLYGRVHLIRMNPLLYPVRSLHLALAHPRDFAHLSWPVFRTAIGGYVTPAVLAAALAGLGITLRARPRVAVLLLVWVLVPFAAALLLPVQPYARHILYVMPPVVAFAGVALATGAGWVRAHTGGAVLGSAVAGALLLAIVAQAALLDTRVLAHPARAHYPGRDDAQYVTGVQAGAIWPAVARELRRRARGRPLTVVRSQVDTQVLAILLRDDHVRFVFPGTPPARGAPLLLRDALPFFDPLGARLAAQRYRLVRTFTRPRGGAAATLSVLRGKP